MNLTAIQALVQAKLNEESAATFYTAAEIVDWVNEGQVEFCVMQLHQLLVKRTMTTALLEKTATIATTGGDWRLYPYTLLSDFMWPLRAVFNNVPLMKTSHKSLDLWDRDWENAVGNPEHWGMIGLNLMFIHPQPAAPANVSLTYAYVPATLSVGGDVPEIGVEFHNALADYAVYKSLLKEGRAKVGIAVEYYKRFVGVSGETMPHKGV